MLDKTPVRLLTLVARVGVGCVFLFAAVGKIEDPAGFALSIANYHLVPDGVATVMAAVMPLLEIVVGLSLVTGLHARGAALLSAGMLAVFAIAMTQAILRDIDVDCGCFGKAATARVGWPTVARNVGLVVASVLVMLSQDVPWTLRSRAERARRD